MTEPVLRPTTEHEKAALRTVLGSRVRTAREHLGFTMRGIARALGMSGSWIREVESGAQFAPAWLLAQLAETTGWNVSWFYGFGFKRGASLGRCASCGCEVAAAWHEPGEQARALVCSAACNTAMEGNDG